MKKMVFGIKPPKGQKPVSLKPPRFNGKYFNKRKRQIKRGTKFPW